MPKDYNNTVNLPKTDFPMRAGLPNREPGMLETFQKKSLYSKLMEKNKGLPKFILHDGPPYANGDIHIGTALNKILKDIIVRYKNMTGYCAPYVPGWDTHGMPIETAIQKKGVKRNSMPVPEFRDKCREFALHFLDRQRDEFIRLGGIGDWEHPYITLKPEFEAKQVEVFGAMARKGYIYQGLKPVYWCPVDETALAEAEVEYQDDPCTSIYVKFRVKNDQGKLAQYCDLNNAYFVIWTTTTWTLPGNLAISLNANFDYDLIRVPGGEVYIMAKDLKEKVLGQAGIEQYEVLATLPGSEFELMTAQHPFLDRESVIITGEHVTLDAGTGCVHTAPGFGADDYLVCKQWDETGKTHIGIVVPVDDRGFQTEEAGPYAGLRYDESSEVILKDLEQSGALLAREELVHSYAHCWRCKKPIIYRATKQWFASVDAIKDAAIAACEDIQWKPDWGKERMISMIRDRNDWCISRQRTWGVPIPIFFCKDCHKPLVNDDTIAAVAELFRKEGSNGWWAHEASEILPAGTKCSCGCTEFTKEQDIMDVWFDSGSTHAAVLDEREELQFPADLYLEGGDQYRGWFQSSMLTSIATKGVAPYKRIITHGWTVDGQGKAMHKSLGNAIAPDEIIKQYGADILRLWVSSADYTQDMRISKDIMKQLSDAYLKIRNTARYMLGNLNGFDPDNLVADADLLELDRWALAQFNTLVENARASYEAYEFHNVYRAIYNFCVVEMSNFYLDIIKDRLYCDGTNSLERRSAQTAMYHILSGMVRLISPILAFTSEEIWAAMPHSKQDDAESVLFNQMPQVNPAWNLTETENAEWAQVQALRADVNKALENARAEKRVGKSLDAAVKLTFTPDGMKTYRTIEKHDLKTNFIVSELEIAEGEAEGLKGENFEGVTITVAPSDAPKCSRCWNRNPKVDPETELCPRCAAVLAAM